MKKLTILTSVLALAACGGGSGGGSSSVAPVMWQPDTVITQDMLNNTRNAQSQQIAKKVQTIEYVENNLGSILENNELSGNPQSAPLHISNRSATSDKLAQGLTLENIEARYQQALGYFDILKKVLNADENTTEKITNRDVKIAYSLSSNTKYENITQENLAGIDLNNDDDEVANDVIEGIKSTITNACKDNEDLQDVVTQEIVEKIPVLTTETNNNNNQPINDENNNGNDTPQQPNTDVSPIISSDVVFNTTNGTMTFGVKDEQIVSVNIDLDYQNLTYNRDVNSDKFVSGNKSAEIISLGKEIGLSFADFGHIKLTDTRTKNGITKEIYDYEVYAGGYNSHEMPISNQNMEFTGKAVATIDAGEDNPDIMITSTDNANLRLEDGKEILTMNFSQSDTPWYDVVVTRSSSENNSLEIKNTNNIESNIPEVYRMTDNMKSNAQNDLLQDPDYFKTTYYGDNQITEAVSTVEFEALDNSSDKMLFFSGAFGGKKE